MPVIVHHRCSYGEARWMRYRACERFALRGSKAIAARMASPDGRSCRLRQAPAFCLALQLLQMNQSRFARDVLALKYSVAVTSFINFSTGVSARMEFSNWSGTDLAG